MTELSKAMQHLRATSPGIDDVDNLMLRNLPISYKMYILDLFNQSWNTETLPDAWKTSLLIPIVKPNKNSTVMSSYRPISLLSCLSKLMERLI